MGVSHYVKQEVARLREENADLKEEVQTLREYIESINTLMEAVDGLNPDSEIMPLLERILYNAQVVINASEGSLLVLDEETHELVWVLASGETGKRLIGRRMSAEKGIAGWVVEHRKPTMVNQVRSDDRFYPVIDRSLQFQTKSILAAPIIGGGQVLGAIEVLNKLDGQPFNETDQTLLTLLCRFAGEVLYVMLEQEDDVEQAVNNTSAQPDLDAD